MDNRQLYQALERRGFGPQPGTNHPSYAYEFELAVGRYLYVKKAIRKNPLVLAPSCLVLRDSIDDITGLTVDWTPTKNTSFRKFPKQNSNSQYGYAAEVHHEAALDELLGLLTGKPQTAPLPTNKELDLNMVVQSYSLNQILYGPPGTGKTYQTKMLAVKIAEPAWYAEVEAKSNARDLREAVKARYDQLVEEQRVMFTTFHQSFSYEDFIEGIRATTDEQVEGIRYEITDGVFKQLCDIAEVKIQADASTAISLNGRRIWKMSLGNTLEGEEYIFDECIDQGYVLLGYGDDIDFTHCNSRQAIKATLEQKYGKPVEDNNYTLSSVHILKNMVRKGDLVIVSDGNHKFRAIAEITGDYEFLATDERVGYQQARRVRWLRQYKPSLPKERLFLKSLSQMTLYELKSTTVDHAKLEQLLAPEQQQQRGPKPHVLIIDEINRGNISRIFGELITLLEPSKRAGAPDAQTAILPYSKTQFSVPDNVFVIGTMNTADKSLAQLDLALRRRFSFVEMLPVPALLNGVQVYGVDMGELLSVINQRIEVLLDQDHLIGHSYFMSLPDCPDEPSRRQELARIFKEHILPLLQEYFFDDFERIGWVLNDPQKSPKHRFIVTQEGMTPVAHLFGSQIAEQISDRRYRINADAFVQAEAYQGIKITTAKEPL